MGFLGAGLGSSMYTHVQPMRLCVVFVGFLGAGLGSSMYTQVQPMRNCVVFVGFLGAGLGSSMYTQVQPMKLCVLLTKELVTTPTTGKCRKGSGLNQGLNLPHQGAS